MRLSGFTIVFLCLLGTLWPHSAVRAQVPEHSLSQALIEGYYGTSANSPLAQRMQAALLRRLTQWRENASSRTGVDGGVVGVQAAQSEGDDSEPDDVIGIVSFFRTIFAFQDAGVDSDLVLGDMVIAIPMMEPTRCEEGDTPNPCGWCGGATLWFLYEDPEVVNVESFLGKPCAAASGRKGTLQCSEWDMSLRCQVPSQPTGPQTCDGQPANACGWCGGAILHFANGHEENVAFEDFYGKSCNEPRLHRDVVCGSSNPEDPTFGRLYCGPDTAL